jgi:hypothetical protein
MSAFFTKKEIDNKIVSKEISSIMKTPHYKSVPVTILKKDGKKKRKSKRKSIKNNKSKRKKSKKNQNSKKKKSKNY